MSLLTNLQALIAAIGADVKPLIPPPLGTFVPGWAFYPIHQIVDVFATGTAHAACSFGPETPTVGSVAFERSSANGGATNVPAGGWAGTNWLVERASSAPAPPTFGDNIGRTEVTAFPGLPDPTNGAVAGADQLFNSSLRRNSYVTISNLTVGNNYYFIMLFGSYPDPLANATFVNPSDGGDSAAFGVDGIETLLAKGIRRYGFTATATSISFLKSGPDTSSSYQNGFVVLDQGT